MAEMATAADEKIHELKDILVEEVSVVDRAANKRKFILVKRDGSLVMAEGTEVEKNAKADAEKEDEAKKAKDQKAADDKAAADKEAAEAKKAADAKDAKAAADKEEAEKAKAKADAKKMPMDEDDDEKAKAKKADEPTAADLAKALIEKADTADMDVLEHATKQLIAKAGARMSKDRFNRFKQAMDLLMSVFGELKPAGVIDAPADKKGEKKAKTKKADETTAPVKKSAEPDPRDALIDKLTEQVSGLTSIVKSQGSRVQRMEKSRGAGNARTVEGGSETVREPVSWPSDMNKPINRDTVNKERWLD